MPSAAREYDKRLGMVRYGVRIPIELLERLKQAAYRDCRSLNNEFEALLELGLSLPAGAPTGPCTTSMASQKT